MVDRGSEATAYFKRGEDVLSTTSTNLSGSTWGPEDLIASAVAGQLRAVGETGSNEPVLGTSTFTALQVGTFAGTPKHNFFTGAITQETVRYRRAPSDGNLTVHRKAFPSLTWTADDPADVDLQQQRLALDGRILSISASNSIDLTPALVTDHGQLTGLGDDDHPHYFLGDGSEPFGGSLNLGGNNITAVGTLTVTGSANLPAGSVGGSELASSVMIAGENVSLLNNDAGYIPDTGDATLTGNFSSTGDIEAAGSFKFATPKTRKLQIPAWAFQANGAAPYASPAGAFRVDAGVGVSDLFAPVIIPPGATITGLTGQIYEKNAPGDNRILSLFSGAIVKRDMSASAATINNSTTLGSFSFTDFGGISGADLQQSTTAITSGTISADEQVFLIFTIKCDTVAGNIGLLGATIEYTTDTLSP